MKAYRRGLQDYEYCWLLTQKGKRSIADKAILKVIPVALTVALSRENQASGLESEAADRGTARRQRGTIPGPSWSSDVDAWYRLHEELASALDAK
jgi:hypothetical protein